MDLWKIFCLISKIDLFLDNKVYKIKIVVEAVGKVWLYESLQKQK